MIGHYFALLMIDCRHASLELYKTYWLEMQNLLVLQTSTSSLHIFFFFSLFIFYSISLLIVLIRSNSLRVIVQRSSNYGRAVRTDICLSFVHFTFCVNRNKYVGCFYSLLIYCIKKNDYMWRAFVINSLWIEKKFGNSYVW